MAHPQQLVNDLSHGKPNAGRQWRKSKESESVRRTA
jgi:hypothetical protein